MLNRMKKRKKYIHKISTLFVCVCVVFLNMPCANVYAAEVVHAAEKAEAQQTFMVPSAGQTNAPDSLYTFIGSGFIGLGKQLKSMSQDSIKKFGLATQLPTSPKTVVEPRMLNLPTLPASVPVVKPGVLKPSVLEPIPMEGEKEIAPIPSAEVTVAQEIEKIIPLIEDGKEKPKEVVQEEEEEILIYLPSEEAGSEELAAMLEGELGAGIFAAHKGTYAVIGLALAAVGIVFLVLGNSGSGGDDSSSRGGSGGGGGDDDDDGGDTTPVPEPGTLCFLFSGLVGLMAFRRRFKITT